MAFQKALTAGNVALLATLFLRQNRQSLSVNLVPWAWVEVARHPLVRRLRVCFASSRSTRLQPTALALYAASKKESLGIRQLLNKLLLV